MATIPGICFRFPFKFPRRLMRLIYYKTYDRWDRAQDQHLTKSAVRNPTLLCCGTAATDCMHTTSGGFRQVARPTNYPKKALEEHTYQKMHFIVLFL